MRIQGIPVSILLPPAEVVLDQFLIGKRDHTAVKYRLSSQGHGEGTACNACKDGVVLSDLPSEGILIGVKQQGNLIALRETVDNTESVGHQGFYRVHHAKPREQS